MYRCATWRPAERTVAARRFSAHFFLFLYKEKPLLLLPFFAFPISSRTELFALCIFVAPVRRPSFAARRTSVAAPPDLTELRRAENPRGASFEVASLVLRQALLRLSVAGLPQQLLVRRSTGELLPQQLRRLRLGSICIYPSFPRFLDLGPVEYLLPLFFCFFSYS